ncbi:hypothetical protein DSO57_1034932 [Entomophthora muscae]|uniref:Uncharacterized protein n=1 Tax=Entomophthora muscae TaxID=34485 RepID=A0ACC2SP03_9FUNG|nr:hypothetical protein DSO57_1034932 [Entomophthora muscae]
MLSEETNLPSLGFIFTQQGVLSNGKLPIKDIYSLLSSNIVSENELDPQVLLLLKEYVEENSSLELSFDELNNLLSELNSSLALRLISKSLPEAPIVNFQRHKEIQSTASRRKSLLAHRRRTNPLPENLDIFSVEEEGDGLSSFGTSIPRNRASMNLRNGNLAIDSMCSSPGLGLSQSPNPSIFNRLSVGFEPSQEHAATPLNSENTVRKVTSELSKKLASEKGLYSTLAQETKLQISELESANEALKDKVKDLSKTVWDLKSSKKQQERVLVALEEETTTFQEKEAALKKEIQELKRITQEKSLLEKKLRKDLENSQSRLADSEKQAYHFYEAQKNLNLEKTKHKEIILCLKRDNDRLGLELHQKELLYLDVIKNNELDLSLSAQANSAEVDSDDSTGSLTNSPQVEDSTPVSKLNSFQDHLSSRKKAMSLQGSSTRQKLKLKDALESICGLWEDVQVVLSENQSGKSQDLNERFKIIKEQLQSSGSSLLKTQTKKLMKEYPVLSARGRKLNARRGSSSHVSPKRLSLLLPPSNLKKEHSDWEAESENIKERSYIYCEPLLSNEELLSDNDVNFTSFSSTDTPLTSTTETPRPFQSTKPMDTSQKRLQKLNRDHIESVDTFSNAIQDDTLASQNSPNQRNPKESANAVALTSQDVIQTRTLTRHERSISDFSSASKVPGYIHTSFKKKGLGMKSYTSSPLDSSSSHDLTPKNTELNKDQGQLLSPSFICKADRPKEDEQSKKARSNFSTKNRTLSPRLPIGVPALAITCTSVETKPVLLSPPIGHRATMSLNYLLSPQSPSSPNLVFSPVNATENLLECFSEYSQGIACTDAEALSGKWGLS